MLKQKLFHLVGTAAIYTGIANLIGQIHDAGNIFCNIRAELGNPRSLEAWKTAEQVARRLCRRRLAGFGICRYGEAGIRGLLKALCKVVEMRFISLPGCMWRPKYFVVA